jgi:nicotinate dehydrogenase subunit B
MAAAAMPGGLVENPRLGQWVAFRSVGEVTISTGKVEIGQGVLTALVQIAAEELDVAIERIVIRSGDTELTPNEGYTSGSQSIQHGGVALRQLGRQRHRKFTVQVAFRPYRRRPQLGAVGSAGEDFWPAHLHPRHGPGEHVAT